MHYKIIANKKLWQSIKELDYCSEILLNIKSSFRFKSKKNNLYQRGFSTECTCLESKTMKNKNFTKILITVNL